MTILLKDEISGIEAGIRDDGKLFFGDNQGGYNLPDNPNNREYIKRDFVRYTGKSVEYGRRWLKRKKMKACETMTLIEATERYKKKGRYVEFSNSKPSDTGIDSNEFLFRT